MCVQGNVSQHTMRSRIEAAERVRAGIVYSCRVVIMRELRLLGEPVASSDGVERTLARKDAALLAYLTLAGAASRSKLAGLLWPEAGEAGARANLRQLLKRLKGRLGGGIVVLDDPVRLAEDTRVDVAEVKVAAFQGRRDRVLAASGVLLEPFDYDDCPAFEDWLFAEREELDGLTRTALVEAIAELERSGALGEALRLAEALIRRDPISETAHTTAMRLHLAAGDRGLALAAFERLHDTLERELGIAPSAETVALAEAIRRGEAEARSAAPAAAAERGIPATLLRPPRLVGREAELAELDAALAAGATALVAGPAGVGKSRLAEEALRGPVLRCEGLSHDTDVPLATLDRGLARFWQSFPALVPPGDVLADVAALLPGVQALTPRPRLPRPSEPPPAGGRSRFRGALARLLGTLMERGVTLLCDDLHAFDAASFEALMAAAEALRGDARDRPAWRAVASLRPGELAPQRRAALERAVAGGTARWITLRPLTRDAVTALLASLELGALPAGAVDTLAARLHRHTGGNVLFVVECLKDLLAAGGPAGDEVRLPMPQRVGQIIRQRVARLPAPAQRLALAAAVAQGAFDLTVLAAMLDAEPLGLEGELRALEQAQVIHEGAFTHDLIGEALLETAPEPVRRYLEGRAAEVLAGVDAEPALVARHWLDAGRSGEALPYLLRAAGRAASRLAYREAAGALYQAGRILADEGREAEAFERLAEAYELVIHANSGDDATRIIAALERLARTRTQQATAAHARAGLLATGGHGAEAEAAARRGLEAARDAGDPALEGLLANDLATALFAREAFEDAADAFGACVDAARERGDDRALVEAMANRAVALTRLDRHDRAIDLHRQAAELLESLGDASGRITVLTNLGVSLSETGRVAEALATHERVAQLLAGLPEVGYAQLVHWANIGLCERDLDHLGRALELLQRAAAAAAELDYWGSAAIDRHLAELHRRLGDGEAALWHARRALEQAAGRTEQELSARLQLAAVLLGADGGADGGADAGPQAARAELGRAEPLLAAVRPSYVAWYHLLAADALAADTHPDLDGACRHAGEALAIAGGLGLHGHRLPALACLSRLARARGAAREAAEHGRAAAALLGTYAPRYGTAGEVLLAHAAALEAAREPGADAAYRACRAWLERVTHDHVPPERRDAFLRHDAVHRALMTA